MFRLFLSIALCQTAGAIGAFFTRQAILEWYFYLKKPYFTPPNWVFGPVWVVLYTLMGVAAFLVWRKGLREVKVRAALAVFLLQLVLNCLWSIVFFGFRSIGGGLSIILLLWIVIFWTIMKFSELSRVAAGLLIPYIVWVSYAVLLNVVIKLLN